MNGNFFFLEGEGRDEGGRGGARGRCLICIDSGKWKRKEIYKSIE
jgi:hypothetical protein